MDELLTFVVLAGLAEAATQVLIQLIEGIKKHEEGWWKLPVSCVVAALLLFASGLNIFTLMNVPLRIGGEFALAFAALLGGVLVGRYGAAIHDILKGIQGVSNKAQADAVVAVSKAEEV